MRYAAVLAIGLLIVFVLAAAIPTHVADLVSTAAPVRQYAVALRRIERRQAVDDRVAVAAGRTVLMTHGGRTPRAVVLFHGFTNSPRQYEQLAQRLFDSGDNVYIPRLPHHAERNGTARTLARLTAEELAACGDSAIDVGNGLGDSVIAVGVSAGATVAAWLAQQRRDVHRAVIIAPVLEIGRIPSGLSRPIMNLGLWLPNVTRSESPDLMRPDRDLGVSTHAIAQLLRLGYAVRRLAQRAPPQARDVVFIVNANDHTVKTAPTLALAHRWSASTSVAVYEFPRSLNLPHDIAEVSHPNADTAAVYPVLEAVIHGDAPFPPATAPRVWPP